MYRGALYEPFVAEPFVAGQRDDRWRTVIQAAHAAG